MIRLFQSSVSSADANSQGGSLHPAIKHQISTFEPKPKSGAATSQSCLIRESVYLFDKHANAALCQLGERELERENRGDEAKPRFASGEWSQGDASDPDLGCI